MNLSLPGEQTTDSTVLPLKGQALVSAGKVALTRTGDQLRVRHFHFYCTPLAIALVVYRRIFERIQGSEVGGDDSVKLPHFFQSIDRVQCAAGPVRDQLQTLSR